MTFIRQCSRPGCSKPAVATLEFNYADQVAIVGPLQAAGNPHRWDLCEDHARRTTVPQGWRLEFAQESVDHAQVIDSTYLPATNGHAEHEEEDESELLALAEAVRQAQDNGGAVQPTAAEAVERPRVIRRAEIPQPTGRHPSRKNLPTGSAPKRHLRAVRSYPQD